ncbi:MAG: hypothetical protein A2136_01040 [Chloroflexi bacterium RBG_16_54_11]|nr:MAG: hypothetical protein A2136_01040 [Chloroflexi bacterium RBG_16_54_11]
MLPADTLVYVTGTHFDQHWQTYLQVALGVGAEQGFLDGFQQAFGFSLRDDLLTHLMGDWAFYVVPSSEGLLADQADINLAVSLLVQSDGAIDFKSIAGHLGDAGLGSGITVVERDREGASYYEVVNQFNDFPIFAFGSEAGYAMFGSDLSAIQTPFTANTNLLASTDYQAAQGALPGGMQATFYLDIQSLFGNIREGLEPVERESFNEITAYFDQVELIASGNRLLNPGVAHNSMVILLSGE